MKHLKPRFMALGVALSLFYGTQAHAVIVPAGTDVALPDTPLVTNPNLAGTVLIDETTHFSFALSGGGTLSGDVQERVVRETSTGTLDFYWRVFNITGGSLGALRIGNFGNGTFDASYRTDGMGAVAPNVGSHFSGTQANFFNFVFQDPAHGNAETLGPGEGSYFLLLHTTATAYNTSASFDVTTNLNGASASYSTFAPAVPEPETYAMLLGGLGLVGAIARRRKQA